jgi:predicted RNA-binding protein with PIN domain
MFYLIDGYNVLFYYLDSKRKFANQRSLLIQYFQEKFAQIHLSGILVFDGSHKRDEESGLSYKSPLEIVYTPKGQNADSYIVEKLTLSKNPKQITVVTNDKGLERHALAQRAHVQTSQDFIRFLEKKSQKPLKEKTFKETPHHFDRLLKIFESKREDDQETTL